MKKQNNGPAFPYREEDGQGGYEQHKGMTLRDYFAGQALAGLLASGEDSIDAETNAHDAYIIADAMIKAREASK